MYSAPSYLTFPYFLSAYKKGQKGKKEASEQKRKDKKKNGTEENDKSRDEEEDEHMDDEQDGENEGDEEDVENWGSFIGSICPDFHQIWQLTEVSTLIEGKCWHLAGHEVCGTQYRWFTLMLVCKCGNIPVNGFEVVLYIIKIFILVI